MIITIDGPAAAGKGTLSEALAKAYGLVKFDTGMLYRAVGIYMVRNNQDLHDEQLAEQAAQNLTFQSMMELSKDVDFRSAVGANAASVVSAHPLVRKALLKMQQDFAVSPCFADGTPANGVVYDGRDTGTVICPHAPVKFFITASSEVRAKRRYDEYVAAGKQVEYEEVLADVRKRDERDSSRSSAPLKPAEDALIVDTSLLNIEEVIAKAKSYIDEKMLAK